MIDKIAGIITIVSQRVNTNFCFNQLKAKTSTGKTLTTMHKPAVATFPLKILKIAMHHESRMTMAFSHLK
ncbi:hypothetical protein LBHL_18400 [Lactobacillus helveticus]|nr:hypothetical protein LBHL_18400 [Lactobacillus helveticus]